MQFKLTLLATILYSSLQAQTTNNINKVEVLNVYGNGKIIIANAIINKTLETKVHLIKTSQSTGSDGLVTTIFDFGNTENFPLFSVDLLISFDKPSIVSVFGYVGQTISIEISDDWKRLSFKAGQINRPFDGSNTLFKIKVESMPGTKIDILKGIDGVK